MEALRELIYTTDRCIGCNRCISACPVLTANHVVELGEHERRIQVDASKCIACGSCLDACEHNARGFEDDLEHPLIGTALHFHLSESRAKSTEALALDNLWLELPWWF